MKSTKILYKGTPHWISTKDLENNKVEKLFVFKDPELTTLLKTYDDMVVMIRKSDIEEKLRENAGGAGGAGYAVWGGGWGRTFGNPSMGGRYTGRGFGFGSSSQNLHGGPNLMYTYDVKPLNRMLQPDPTTQDEDMEYIHVGTLVRGKELKTNNEVEGKIVHIEEDEENNVSYYEVIDEDEGLKRRLDPTTVYVLDRNDGIENDEWYKMDIVGESFYPLLESLNENYEDYMDPGCNYINKYLDLNPNIDEDEFTEYVTVHNKADRDMGELQDINKEEIERLGKKFKKSS